MDKKRSINTGNKRILEIAIPSIISNITVPLLGLIDVTIVGHLGSAAYIGAIAIGGMLFNIIYWIFGFLRMGTSGMTSQAYGQRNLDEVTRLLLRSVGIGLLIALCLLLLQYPIQKTAFTLITTRESGNSLFSYLYLGCPCRTRTLWFCRMVYRDAEFTFSHVYRDHTEYREYNSQPQLCLPTEYESRRSRLRHTHSPIRRIPDGSPIMDAPLQTAT